MTKIRSVCCALGAGALAALAGCSSNEAASDNEYPQPAASQGDETTPQEPTTRHATGPSGAEPSNPSDVAVSAGPTAANTTVSSESLRDSQIVQVTKSVDQAEIEQATVARNKATDPRVKTFAEHMIDQHSRSLKDGADLAHKAGIEPEDSKLAAELQGKGGQLLQTLRGIDASQFDSTYMNAQVKQHGEVLEILDQRLIPSAGNADLRAALKDARAMVASHLADATSLQSKLKQ